VTVLVDDLDALWHELDAHLAVRGALRYPGMPSTDAVAAWPDDDWRAFLDVGAAAGARLVYTMAATIGPDDVEELTERLTRHDGTLAPEARAVLADANERVGTPATVTVGYVVDGVLHVWRAEATWWDAITVQAEVEEMHAALEASERESAAEAEWSLLESEVPVWASDLAARREFWGAANDAARRAVASSAIPPLGSLLDADRTTSTGRRAYSLGLRVLREATRIVRSEVLPRLEAEGFARLEALAIQLRADAGFVAAASATERRRAARALLDRELGHATPALADALARRAATGP
jgi:hypothetical protein